MPSHPWQSWSRPVFYDPKGVRWEDFRIKAAHLNSISQIFVIVTFVIFPLHNMLFYLIMFFFNLCVFSTVHLCSIYGDSENHTALDLKLVFPLITYNIMEQVIYHSLLSLPPGWMMLTHLITRITLFFFQQSTIIKRTSLLTPASCALINLFTMTWHSKKWSCDSEIVLLLHCQLCLCVCLCVCVYSPDERRFCVFSLAASTDSKEILGGWVSHIAHTPTLNLSRDYQEELQVRTQITSESLEPDVKQTAS